MDMKKIFVLLCASMMLTSCYSVTYCCGDMKEDTPAVKVNSVQNPGFICGLVQTKKSKLVNNQYTDGMKNYKVKHCITFVDGLLEAITLGIYTPSTTYYYAPLNNK